MQIELVLIFAALFGLNSSQAQQPATTDSVPVTVLTGCLRSSGADTAIAGPSGRLYTLEVVAPPKAAAATTTSSTPPVASVTTYSLSAAESVGLAKHADHKVQLTGKLQAPSTAAAKPASSRGTATEPKPQPGGGHRTFEVSALKMVSASCTAQ